MKESDIKISVIVPVYNTSKYLEKCMESILNQSLKEIEVICINDGSTDNSLKILEKISKQDRRVKVINQINKGLTATRNIGLRLAKGKYIINIDSDDWIEKDYFENIFYKAEVENLDLVCSGINIAVNEKIVKTFKDSYMSDEMVIGGEYYLRGLLEDLFWGAIWNKLIKREIYMREDIFFNENIFIGEDYEFLCRLASKLNRIESLEKAYYIYRKGDNNGSGKIKEKNMEDVLKLFDSLEETYYFNEKVMKILNQKKCIDFGRFVFNIKYHDYDTYKIIEDEFLKLIKKVNYFKVEDRFGRTKKMLILINFLIFINNKYGLKFIYFLLKLNLFFKKRNIKI